MNIKFRSKILNILIWAYNKRNIDIKKKVVLPDRIKYACIYWDIGAAKDWILVGAIEDDSHIKLNRISRHRPSPTNKFKPSNTRIIPSIARFSSDKVDPVPDLAQHEARYSAAWDYLAIPGSLLWSNWQAICSPRGGRTGRLHLSLRGIRLNVTKAERTHAHAYTHSHRDFPPSVPPFTVHFILCLAHTATSRYDYWWRSKYFARKTLKILKKELEFTRSRFIKNLIHR